MKKKKNKKKKVKLEMKNIINFKMKKKFRLGKIQKKWLPIKKLWEINNNNNKKMKLMNI